MELLSNIIRKLKLIWQIYYTQYPQTWSDYTPSLEFAHNS